MKPTALSASVETREEGGAPAGGFDPGGANALLWFKPGKLSSLDGKVESGRFRHLFELSRRALGSRTGFCHSQLNARALFP
jgi:hypothetical protein